MLPLRCHAVSSDCPRNSAVNAFALAVRDFRDAYIWSVPSERGVKADAFCGRNAAKRT
ncbi:hypothetical protein SCOCK_10383 [Actinacidiphila cocklensis]|uniref:Uncharacterized protein n=1 Tax=Actinacidiphila cocklensis TaxID=887465 RepID=A0A9W4E1J3_9ACTN|nr:hypothetical protein SCOCK_10383 [Actinacidiphila cocklensis]